MPNRGRHSPLGGDDMRILRWFFPLLFVTGLAHAQTGYLIRDDCTSLTGVQYNTLCYNSGNTGTLTQGILYHYGTAGWTAVDTSSSPSLQTAKNTGATITNAVDATTGVIIGNGTVNWNDFCDSSNVCRRQVTDTTGTRVRGDYVIEVETNKTFIIYDEEGAAAMWTIDPDAASANAMYQIASGYRPRKSVFLPAGALSTDGTNCAAPAEATINSGAVRWTITCADSDSSTIYGEVQMPDAWDGGTVTAMGSFVQTAADTNPMNSDIAFACRANGDTINNTWGTEVAMDIANMGGSSKINTVTTSAATPNGTCTGNGTLLQFRWQLDAGGTTTAVATLHVLGFKIEYTVSSLSD